MENLMHHLKETTIDGVKFVLIPEELHDLLVAHIVKNLKYVSVSAIGTKWMDYDPEIFNGL
jgi:hypothetical protein